MREMSATTEKKLAVLMFTDVVDSVGLQKRIGSRAFAEQIRQHDTLFQRVIDLTEGGQVLQHTGDGFMLSFSTASEAVEAALRLQMLFSRETWPAGYPERSAGGRSECPPRGSTAIHTLSRCRHRRPCI